jgi:hypothetical protein
MGGEGETSSSSDGIPALAFVYEAGRLQITIPRDIEGEGEPINPDSVAAAVVEVREQVQQAAMLRGFLNDARLAVSVELPGAVTETNARYVEDGVVTLVDLRFGAFFDLMAEDPELAARFQLAETTEDRQTVLEEINAYDGLRFEPEEVVTVRMAE